DRADVALEPITSAQGGIARRRRTIPAPARQTDLDQVSRLEDLLGLGVRGHAPVDQHRARRPRRAAEEALRGNAGAIAQERAGEGPARAQAEGYPRAEPAAIAAITARVGPQPLALDHEWRERLDDLRRRPQHAGGKRGGGEPVLGRPCAGAAG